MWLLKKSFKFIWLQLSLCCLSTGILLEKFKAGYSISIVIETQVSYNWRIKRRLTRQSLIISTSDIMMKFVACGFTSLSIIFSKKIIYLQPRFSRGSSRKFHSTNITNPSLLYFRKNQTCWTSLSLVLMVHSTREVDTNRIGNFYISLKNGGKIGWYVLKLHCNYDQIRDIKCK